MTKKPETRNITLAKLSVSEDNTRKTDIELGKEQMMASLAAKGQLTPIIVHPSGEKGKFEIADGQRRYLVAKALVEGGQLPKNFALRCEVRDADDAQEVSLVTNVMRMPMHPADEFVAFRDLTDQGFTVEEIANRFGAKTTLVEKRLRLAKVAPEIFEAYRRDEISLEVLQAYSITEDQERQVSVFKSLGHSQSAYNVRTRVTETTVPESDRRVKFVIVEKYLEAGGVIETDLFQENRYITDIDLLERLVDAKLEHFRQEYLKDGWSWVAAHRSSDDFEWGNVGRMQAESVELSDEDAIELQSLMEEAEPLSERNDLTDEEFDRAEELTELIDELECKKRAFSTMQKSEAGVLLSIDRNGDLDVDLGLCQGVAGQGGTASKTSKPKAEISDRHMTRLKGHRTLALQTFIMQDSKAAFTLLLAELAEIYFRTGATRLLSGIGSPSIRLGLEEEEVEPSTAYAAFIDEDAKWRYLFSDADACYVEIVSSLDDEKRHSLLAFLLATRIDATNGIYAPDEETVERAVSLTGRDMADHWEPTAEGHFQHVSKDVIAKHVEEASGPEAASKLMGMSKKDMAVAAERQTSSSRWVPAPMRMGAAKERAQPLVQAADRS